MISASVAATLLILVPLHTAILAYITGKRSHNFFLLLTPPLLLALTFQTGMGLWQNGAVRIPLGGWEAPLGINLYVDGLAVFMLAVTALVGTFVSMFSSTYYSEENKVASDHESGMFVPLWLFLWASLNAVFLSADAFNIYVVFELIGISAIALITLSDKTPALHAAMRYMLAAFIGSLIYLAGVALLYSEAGTLDFFLLREAIGESYLIYVCFGLMAAGLFLKTALFPMHFWLPPAHSSASPPVSALLSALVIKASLFVFIRLWFDVFYGAVTVPAGHFIGFLGAAAILWGSIQALRQKRLKLIVAHSTVAQVGYMFLLFPLTALTVAAADPGASAWLSEALSGFTYQVVSHALAKSSMFLSAGIVFYAYGNDKLESMRGMSSKFPITTFALALSGISLMGLPPSGGFAAKWLIMKAAIGSGQWWWIPVIVVGGLLTAGYVFLMLRFAFQKVETDSAAVETSSGIISGTASGSAVRTSDIGKDPGREASSGPDSDSDQPGSSATGRGTEQTSSPDDPSAGKPGIQYIGPDSVQKVKKSLEFAALALAILAIIIGFRLEEPLMLLQIGSPFIETGGGP